MYWTFGRHVTRTEPLGLRVRDNYRSWPVHCCSFSPALVYVRSVILCTYTFICIWDSAYTLGKAPIKGCVRSVCRRVTTGATGSARIREFSRGKTRKAVSPGTVGGWWWGGEVFGPVKHNPVGTLVAAALCVGARIHVEYPVGRLRSVKKFTATSSPSTRSNNQNDENFDNEKNCAVHVTKQQI